MKMIESTAFLAAAVLCGIWECAAAEKAQAVTPQAEMELDFRKPHRDIRMLKEGYIWIDAEDFGNYGGWTLDTQFAHLMGSAYLMASNLGRPAADATVGVDISAAGRYRAWVRARNWNREYSPGQFTIAIGGKVSKNIFGKAPSEEWIWEQAGDFELSKGNAVLALRDLTGYYGRCDAIVLTTDFDYVPPAGVGEIRKERARLTGISLEPKPAGEFDVIVVGAGTAGSCAAVASARGGAKTALIQDRPVLGGNASVELGVSVDGAASAGRHSNAREGGIIEEVGRIKAWHGYVKVGEPFRILMEQEKNLSIFMNSHVSAVEMSGKDRISSVIAVNTLTNETSEYRGRYFIDCTGDGWVGFSAGAKYRIGREARSEFNESLAPEKADSITMSGSIMGKRSIGFRAEDAGKPVAYSPPPWAAKLPPAGEFVRTIRGFSTGAWWLEHEGTIDDLYDAEKARDELIRITYGYWDFIKNKWPEREKAANYAMTYVPIMNGKRETRRFIGDYVLTQNDVAAGKFFDDAVSYGGWPLDVHHPKGVYSSREGPYYSNLSLPIYTIPYRCLYAVNIDNLFFAGRDVSVTHLALGTVRVQGTLATLGQAAGTAAAMCASNGIDPRDIYKSRMKDLQQKLLKDDQHIPGLASEDSSDLARNAKISSSSKASFETFLQGKVIEGKSHSLSIPRAVMFPGGTVKKIGKVSVFLSSDKTGAADVELHLRRAEEFGDFSSDSDLAVAKAKIQPGKPSWIAFPLDCEVEAPFLWIWIPKTDGVSWHLMSNGPPDSCRAYGDGKDSWTDVKGEQYAFKTEPPLSMPFDFSPGNVINGVARTVGGRANQWASDPEGKMPQWIELDFGSPRKINSVYLTFDTDMNARGYAVAKVPRCVKDYELSVGDGKNWKTVALVKDNYQRRRIHRFEPAEASRLKLTVLATNGDRSARVFEIRAYNE